MSSCLEKDVFIPNTRFRSKFIHIYTHNKELGLYECRSMIDLIAFDKRLKGLMKDVGKMKGSEHRCILEKMDMEKKERIKERQIKVEQLQKKIVHLWKKMEYGSKETGHQNCSE